MTLDHSEFIRRHHKPDHGVGSKQNNAVSVWAIAFTAIAYIGFCIATMQALKVHETALFVFILLLLGALLGGYAIQLVIRFFSPQEKQRSLLIEILEASHGARLITDGSNNVVLSNGRFDALCRGTGDITYDTLLKLFAATEENRAHFKTLADQAHRGLTDHADLKIVKDDHDVWMRVQAQPVPGWAGYIHWRLDDITEEFVRNRSISEEREKLIDFTDNAPVGFFSVDERGRFVFVNATLARWVGADLQNMLWNGQLHHFLIDPPVGAEPYDIKEGGGARQVSEVRMKGPGGRVFLAAINQTVVHETGGRVRTRGIVHDLTAERAMRQALEESEDRFRKFFKEAPLGIMIVNGELIIEECNNVLAEMFSKNLADIEGQPFQDFVDMNDWHNVSTMLTNIQREENPDPVETKLWSVVDQAVLPARMYARKFTDSDKITLQFIDLTQQKNLENQFIQSQKMQAVGQLAGGIAHDFNNLLTAMIGFCDLLLLRHKPGDPSFSDIQQIKQNSNRATNLVRQLLAFSRQQTLRPKVQDITDILTELAHLMRRLIGANIELKLIHGDDLGFVKVDGGQMEQVLINMAVNARDAMPNGGVLSIQTSHFTNDESIPLGADIMPPGHWVRIDVRDTGTGIPPEIMQRIFEPFFTTKDVGQGTGLGLATVFGIVRQTGGYLTVHSEVGSGTTFSVYLPRLSELENDGESSAPVPEEMTGDLTGTARILLVEDEDAVRTFSTRALTNKGYEVETAESGEAGWIKFKDLKKPIDLLITDVIMPGIDGPTLAKQIRAEMPSLKIIFVSGYTEEKLKDQMGDGIHFLPKPFTLKQLAAKVKEVLSE